MTSRKEGTWKTNWFRQELKPAQFLLLRGAQRAALRAREIEPRARWRVAANKEPAKEDERRERAVKT